MFHQAGQFFFTSCQTINGFGNPNPYSDPNILLNLTLTLTLTLTLIQTLSITPTIFLRMLQPVDACWCMSTCKTHVIKSLSLCFTYVIPWWFVQTLSCFGVSIVVQVLVSDVVVFCRSEVGFAEVVPLWLYTSISL